jgi:hypothetical protein
MLKIHPLNRPKNRVETMKKLHNAKKNKKMMYDIFKMKKV